MGKNIHMVCDQLAETIAVCSVITGCLVVETQILAPVQLDKRLTLSKSLKIKTQADACDCGHNAIANSENLAKEQSGLILGERHVHKYCKLRQQQ